MFTPCEQTISVNWSSQYLELNIIVQWSTNVYIFCVCLSCRILPKCEVEKVATFLEHLLSCRTGSLPTDSLVHRYWTTWHDEFQVASDYTKCLKRSKLNHRLCELRNPFYCGRRFGAVQESQLSECHKILSSDTYRPANVSKKVLDKFTKYTQCMRLLRKHIDKDCTSLLSASCNSRQLRATKTVRATMASMEPLLKKLPNFRIIHLIRDPRGVVLSRMKHGDQSVLAKYSLNGGKSEILKREAQLYCRTVVRDLKVRRQLEELYPGRIYPLIFDHLVEDMQQTVNNIYFFLNSTYPINMFAWIKKNSLSGNKRGEKSRDIAARWTKNLTREENDNIREVCREFFDIIEYKWMMPNITKTQHTLSRVRKTYNRLPNIPRPYH